MRSWAAGRLLRAIARHCSGGSGSSGLHKPMSGDVSATLSGIAAVVDAEAVNPASRPSLHVDEPILADFLAMGGGVATVPAPDTANGSGVPPKQDREEVSSVSIARAPTGLGGSDNPDREDVAAHRERRLVAVALQPAEALHQVPFSEKPSRTPMGSSSLHLAPRPLPALFAQATKGEHQQQHSDIDLAFGESPAPPPMAFPDNAVNGTFRRLRSQIDTRPPKAMRQSLCKALLGDFVRVNNKAITGVKGGSAANGRLLTAWERKIAMNHCTYGEVIPLVVHLAETELHIENGDTRRGLMRAPTADSRSPLPSDKMLRDERNALARQWDIPARDLKEKAVLGLFLDRQLSWPRVRALLRNAALLPRPVPKARRAGAAADGPSDADTLTAAATAGAAAAAYAVTGNVE